MGERGNYDVGEFLPLHSAGHPDIWSRELGCDPVNRAYSGGFPPQGGAADLGQATQAAGGRDLIVFPVGRSYAGSQVGRDEELHIHAPEYGREICIRATYYVPLPGGGADYGIAGYREVVGSVDTGLLMPKVCGQGLRGQGRFKNL